MAEFLNVSQASVQVVGATEQVVALIITAAVAEGAKCGRCWRVLTDVGSDARWPTVCARCADALETIGFAPTQEAA